MRHNAIKHHQKAFFKSRGCSMGKTEPDNQERLSYLRTGGQTTTQQSQQRQWMLLKRGKENGNELRERENKT